MLFLDEPFEGVDAVAKASLTALLAGLVQRRRLTVFITSHVLEVVERLCDHVGVIHRGRLVAQGTLQDVVGAVPGAQTLTDAFVALVGEGRGGTRQLSFLKSPALLAVVRSLGAQPSARAACTAAGVQAEDLMRYAHALQTLAASRMICKRGTV